MTTTTSYQGNETVRSGYYLHTARFTIAPVAADGDRLPAGPGSWRRIPTALALLATPAAGLALLLFLPVVGVVLAARAALSPVLGLLRGSAGQLAVTMANDLEPGESYLAGQPVRSGAATCHADDGLTPLLREIERRRAA